MTVGSLQVNRKPTKAILFKSLILLLTFQRKGCRIEGNSMNPTLKQGDFVTYKPYNGKKLTLKEGDIVIASHPFTKEKLIIKRIYKKEDYGVKLIGDNRLDSIDSRQFGLLNYSQIIGIVEHLIPRSL